MNDILSILFYQPIVNLLLVLYKVLFENLPLAVIAITALLRLILWPLYKKQLEGQERIKKIQPKIRALQAQKKKPNEYTVAERAMLSESSKAMGAGCLPTLIQLPFLIALYNVISNIVGDKAYEVSKLAYFDFITFPADYKYHTSFIGLDFSQVPSKIGFGDINIIPFILIIAVVLITQYIYMKLTTLSTSADAKVEIENTNKNSSKNKKSNKVHNELKKNGKKELAKPDTSKKEFSSEDIQNLTNKQMTIILPLLMAFLSWNFAAILSLYLVMQNVLGIIQTVVHNKHINIQSWIKKLSPKS